MIVRIYTGDDERSHFEDLPIPEGETQSFLLQAGGEMVFRRAPDDYFLDWHTAPRRMFVITLTGHVEIAIGDGTVRTFGPGDILLTDDLSGEGHTSRGVGGTRTMVSIPIGD